MKLIDEATRIMDASLNEDPNISIFESMLGGVIFFGMCIGSMVVCVFLLATSPIWGLPYLIYKVRKG